MSVFKNHGAFYRIHVVTGYGLGSTLGRVFSLSLMYEDTPLSVFFFPSVFSLSIAQDRKRPKGLDREATILEDLRGLVLS